jgi:hypothetical protein
VGVWEDISVPGVPLGNDMAFYYGFQALVLNPKDTATLYVGAQERGIFKTSDCGATWTKVNTGTNAAAIDSGRPWTMAIDPVNPEVLYTSEGYGQDGVWKSVNGGVDWQQTFTPGSDPAVYIPNQSVGNIILDPGDHEHLLVSMHGGCTGPYAPTCIAESKDAGVTWKLLPGDPSWDATAGYLTFINATTWLYMSQDIGIWRTTTSGQTWQQILDASFAGHAPGQLYQAKSGTYYMGFNDGLLTSADGLQWTKLANSPNTYISGLVGDGDTMYASHAFPTTYTPFEPYYTASESAPATWSNMPSPMMVNGGEKMVYDPDHHLIYSSNYTAGVWRLRTQ